MKIIIDIEANGLENPTHIWCIVCKDIDTGSLYIFREADVSKFKEFTKGVTLWIGHNLLGYDAIHVKRLIGIDLLQTGCIDTLIISKLLDYSRVGHSVEDYGLEFGKEKIKFRDFSKWSQELEDYCIRDVDITEKIYKKYKKHIDHPDWQQAISLEHKFQLIVNTLHDNGFSFNKKKAEELLAKVEGELGLLDEAISLEFPPRLKLIREIRPKVTKHGTLSRTDFRFVKDGDLSEYNGGPFCRCSWVPFNPSSHSQIIGVLAEAGWSPIEKTQTHIEAERTLNRLRYSRDKNPELTLQLKESIIKKLEILQRTGWKINEQNLNTLPPSAPSPAKTLARRILLEARRRTLRHFPFFGVFGDGNYGIQPIHVDDLAQLAVSQGESRTNVITNAIGPESFTFKGLVAEIGPIIGKERPIIPLPPRLGYAVTRLIGWYMGDVFLTWEEVQGLMAGTLAVDTPPTAPTKLTDCANKHSATLGKQYTSELARRIDRTVAYRSN